MPHDFTTPQPIEGLYPRVALRDFVRLMLFQELEHITCIILHDYPDEKCKVILQLIREATGKDSVILIDEMIIPEQGTHWQAAQLDIAMMSSLSAMERTKKQWYQLVESVGLKIVEIYTYTEELQDSILVAVPE